MKSHPHLKKIQGYEGESDLADSIPRTIFKGFQKHFALFQEITAGAKKRFEDADWKTVQGASRERIYFYDKRVAETLEELHEQFDIQELDEPLWQRIKMNYIHLLLNHKQPELAETYYNSVFCHLFHRRYYNNNNIFVRSSISTEYIDTGQAAYKCYYPVTLGLRKTFIAILRSFDLNLPFEDIRRDLRNIVRTLSEHLSSRPRRAELNFHINVLSSLFFRNKAAYIIGTATNGNDRVPFIVPILNNGNGGLYVDTLLLDKSDLSAVFSFSRAYFMVESQAPSVVVDFLLDMLPSKTKAELYSAIGLHKQGKTAFYRDFLQHLRHSEDNLIVAPGAKGMVMMVFTQPSYPYVFKIIRDSFEPPKDVTREMVKRRYQLVKEHDRVGRLADTLEYSDVAIPKARFDSELLDELFETCGKSLEMDGDLVVIKHVYIERRMKPLNLYLSVAPEAELDQVVFGYGQAIKQMAAVNIFPGDMLPKNFGLTRYDRVVFYDYDEICYLTECNFRHIPPSAYIEDEMSSEPWYSVGVNDVFPEEFTSFFLSHPRVRDRFLHYHEDLLTVEYWQQKQANIRSGIYEDIFPYPRQKRFMAR